MAGATSLGTSPIPVGKNESEERKERASDWSEWERGSRRQGARRPYPLGGGDGEVVGWRRGRARSAAPGEQWRGRDDPGTGLGRPLLPKAQFGLAPFSLFFI